MRATLLRLLVGSPNVMRTIRNIVAHSCMRDCERVRYAVELINIAREEGLLDNQMEGD